MHTFVRPYCSMVYTTPPLGLHLFIETPPTRGDTVLSALPIPNRMERCSLCQNAQEGCPHNARGFIVYGASVITHVTETRVYTTTPVPITPFPLALRTSVAGSSLLVLPIERFLPLTEESARILQEFETFGIEASRWLQQSPKAVTIAVQPLVEAFGFPPPP